MVEQRGRYLVYTKIDQAVLAMQRDLPGRRRWKDGELYVDAVGENIAFIVELYPELVKAKLPAFAEYFKVKDRQSEVLAKKELPPEAAGGFPFRFPPYEHQSKAFALMRDAEYFGLFCEMGTGKTKMLIDNAFDLWRAGHIDAVIVMAPNGVHNQWVEEQIPMHAPEEFQYEAKAWYNGMGVRWSRKFQAVVDSDKLDLKFFTFAWTSLASMKAKEKFVEIMRNYRVLLILDESQAIKNPSAKRTRFIMGQAPHAPYRRIATGTPVTQGLEDLYTQLKFLHPMILDINTYTAYLARYCVQRQIPGAPAGATQIVSYRNVPELREKVQSCTFQVKKADCLDLPDKVYQRYEVPLTKEQQTMYAQMRDLLLAQLESGEIVQAPLAITKMMKLQQITSGHLIDDDQQVHAIPENRTKAVLEIAEIAKRGIVWCRFRHDLAAVSKALETAGYRVGVYAGDTPEEERQRLRKPGEVDWLVANPQSAGTGLNLTHFDTMIYYSNSFNAADRWQSEDRIHRIGQNNKCLYIDLYSPGTIDLSILASLMNKKNVATSIEDVKSLLAA